MMILFLRDINDDTSPYLSYFYHFMLFTLPPTREKKKKKPHSLLFYKILLNILEIL